MKKLLLVLLIMFLAGCGVTNVEDGSDGADGIAGIPGRDQETPVVRPYTWDTSGTVVNFQDVGTDELKSYEIGFNQENNNNFVMIRVPANSIGKEIQVVINGVVSEKVIVPDNNSNYAIFSTMDGINNTWNKYMNCSKLNMDDKDSYFAWYLDGVQQEYYFCDSF